ncbi:hypothetical protein ACI2LC_45940 [Nonomuraea wenchangensis]|uniref:hypothetical protein n=1 Tax=Nonomuraea wenchangensis TaxID=568860 RepID=UPI00384C8BC4
MTFVPPWRSSAIVEEEDPVMMSTVGAALVEVASTDAYAARDVLGHPEMRSHMTEQQQQPSTP